MTGFFDAARSRRATGFRIRARARHGRSRVTVQVPYARSGAARTRSQEYTRARYRHLKGHHNARVVIGLRLGGHERSSVTPTRLAVGRAALIPRPPFRADLPQRPADPTQAAQPQWFPRCRAQRATRHSAIQLWVKCSTVSPPVKAIPERAWNSNRNLSESRLVGVYQVGAAVIGNMILDYEFPGVGDRPLPRRVSGG